jgi:hypothetical protein
MEREIWDIIKALDEKKITAIEAHKKLCGLYSVSGSTILKQCLNEQEEIISNPKRFNGVHNEKLKEVFRRNGIINDEPDF